MRVNVVLRDALHVQEAHKCVNWPRRLARAHSRLCLYNTLSERGSLCSLVVIFLERRPRCYLIEIGGEEEAKPAV